MGLARSRKRQGEVSGWAT